MGVQTLKRSYLPWSWYPHTIQTKYQQTLLTLVSLLCVHRIFAQSWPLQGNIDQKTKDPHLCPPATHQILQRPKSPVPLKHHVQHSYASLNAVSTMD